MRKTYKKQTNFKLIWHTEPCVEKAQIYRMTLIYNYYCKANLNRDKLALNSRFPCKISATHNRLRNRTNDVLLKKNLCSTNGISTAKYLIVCLQLSYCRTLNSEACCFAF